MKPADFKIHELIQSLQGTCSTIEEHLPEGMKFDDLTDDDHQAIDNDVFLCTTCGWWCEMSENHEQDGDWVCDDCYEGGEYD